MEDLLSQGHNLMKQLELEGGGPRTATHPESVVEVLVGNDGSEAAIENHRHHLPNYLHEAYAAVVPPPF